MSTTSTGPILVTGGAGFIGSHTCVELISAGMQPVVLDSFVNSNPGVLLIRSFLVPPAVTGLSIESINRVEQISGKKVQVYHIDLLDREAVRNVFKQVVLFAKKSWELPTKTLYSWSHSIISIR